jgi:hypothetical protein
MVLRRSALLTAALASVALALPALASAKDYCFRNPPGCSGAIYDDGELAKALAAAESNGTDDRFFLGAGPYVNGPFSYQSSERVDIIGAGADKATLESDAPGSVLMLGGNPDSSVRGVTVKPVGSSGVGLRLTGTHARGVSVDATAAPALLAGVIASDGAVFDDGSVDIGSVWMLPDVLVLDNSATVTDSRLVAPRGYGVLNTLSDATVRRSTLDAKFGASASAGHLTVSDSLIDLRGKGSNAQGAAIGVGVGPDGSATTATADLDRLTIVPRHRTRWRRSALLPEPTARPRARRFTSATRSSAAPECRSHARASTARRSTSARTARSTRSPCSRSAAGRGPCSRSIA